MSSHQAAAAPLPPHPAPAPLPRARSAMRGPLAVLAALTFVRLLYGVQFQSLGAVAPGLTAELGLNHASLGTLIGAYTALGLVLALPAGWLLPRLGERRVVLGSLALMAAGGAVIALAPGFGTALAGRLVSGTGAILLLVALPAIIAGRFSAPALPAAMGTLLAGYPLGIALGLVLLPLLGAWRDAMEATVLLAVVALGAAALTLAPDRGRDVPAVPRPSVRLPRREGAAVAAAGLAWGFPNAAFATLLGFGPAYFTEHGLPPATAGALAGLVALATVPPGPFGGWLLGRLGRPMAGMAAGLLVLALSAALLAAGGAPVPLLVLGGVALGTVSGPIVALPAAVVPPERRAMAMALFWTVFFLPMSVLPALAGLGRDLSGAAAAPLAAASLFGALGVPALLLHAWLRRPAARPGAASGRALAAGAG
ncbi:MAG TPA: MFS transporter [Acetobacteraceae bacterium]|nr:MFS transporter [Acetobacteraceae bacterium]